MTFGAFMLSMRLGLRSRLLATYLLTADSKCRIRAALPTSRSGGVFCGPVEVDEANIGVKVHNKYASETLHGGDSGTRHHASAKDSLVSNVTP